VRREAAKDEKTSEIIAYAAGRRMGDSGTNYKQKSKGSQLANRSKM
jgi:hypothetical protein